MFCFHSRTVEYHRCDFVSRKQNIKAFTIDIWFLARGGGPHYDGYGSGAYNQGGYDTVGFGSGYGGGAPFGYNGGGYDDRNRFENREQKDNSSGAFGLVGDLIGN